MRLHYAWIVAGVAFLAPLAAAGVRATNVVLILPLEHELRWGRAPASPAPSGNLLLYGFCGRFAGALMTRFGVRRVMLAALATLAVAAAVSTFMQSAWQLVALWGVLLAWVQGRRRWSWARWSPHAGSSIAAAWS